MYAESLIVKLSVPVPRGRPVLREGAVWPPQSRLHLLVVRVASRRFCIVFYLDPAPQPEDTRNTCHQDASF